MGRTQSSNDCPSKSQRRTDRVCLLPQISYLRFYEGCKVHGIDRNTFPYKAPFQPYASYFGLVLVILVIFFNGFSLFLSDSWNTTDFVIDYITGEALP